MKIELEPGIITPFGEEWLYRHVLEQPPIAGGASLGNAVENKVLDHLTNQSSLHDAGAVSGPVDDDAR